MFCEFPIKIGCQNLLVGVTTEKRSYHIYKKNKENIIIHLQVGCANWRQGDTGTTNPLDTA